MTTQKIRTNVYLNQEIKEQAKEIFKKYGLGLSEAVNIFLTQSVYNRGIPFEIKLPNDKTLKAIEEAKNLDGDFITLDELKK